MEQCFSIYFLGQEIVLPKDIVYFIGDYGIIKTVWLNEDEDYKKVLFGIVDKNYKTIVPLIFYDILDKFSFLQDNRIILKLNSTPDRLYLIEVLENKHIFNILPYVDYELVDNRLVKVKNILFDDVYALYDTSENRMITSYFHHISDFYYDESKNTVCALVVYFVPYNDGQYNQIITYIDFNGNVIEPYLDVDNEIQFDMSMKLSEVVALVQQNMDGYIR